MLKKIYQELVEIRKTLQAIQSDLKPKTYLCTNNLTIKKLDREEIEKLNQLIRKTLLIK